MSANRKHFGPNCLTIGCAVLLFSPDSGEDKTEADKVWAGHTWRWWVRHTCLSLKIPLSWKPCRGAHTVQALTVTHFVQWWGHTFYKDEDKVCTSIYYIKMVKVCWAIRKDHVVQFSAEYKMFGPFCRNSYETLPLLMHLGLKKTPGHITGEWDLVLLKEKWPTWSESDVMWEIS